MLASRSALGAASASLPAGRPGTRFEVRGEFAGFIRTAEGKRRMLLRTAAGEWRVKIPKALRKPLEPLLSAGCVVAVAGIEQRDSFGDAVKHVASHVRLLDPPLAEARRPPCAACPIRVCAKKNCWRAGGRQLWEMLERRVEELGLAGCVELKATGCLGNCKRAPNAVGAGDRLHERCGAGDADAILRRAIAG